MIYNWVLFFLLLLLPYLTNSVTIKIELSEQSRQVPRNCTMFLCCKDCRLCSLLQLEQIILGCYNSSVKNITLFIYIMNSASSSTIFWLKPFLSFLTATCCLVTLFSPRHTSFQIFICFHDSKININIKKTICIQQNYSRHSSQSQSFQIN